MPQAHNTWSAEAGIPPPYAQPQYHDQNPQSFHEAYPSSSPIPSGTPPSSYIRERERVQRTDSTVAPLPHIGHGLPPVYAHSGATVAPSATRSPILHPQPTHGGFEAVHPRSSSTQQDAKLAGEQPRGYESAASDSHSQSRPSILDQSPIAHSSGYHYPSAVERRLSTGNFTSSMQPPNWSPGGMAPPLRTAPSHDAVATTSTRHPLGDQPRDMAPGGSMARGGRTLAMVAKYRICVRQHPVAARSCGFGERDRRVIDPPPIIQVLIDDPQIPDPERQRILRYPWGVMHCTIWSEDGQRDCSGMQDDFRTNKRLMGTPVSSPFVGFDDKGEEGCFYCFPDLSVRTPGAFRLHFSLAILDPSMQKNVPVVAGVMSDVFRVYNAKDFPGMQASTALTKTLKKQGCLISIKKGKEHTGAPRLLDSGDEDEDEDGGGGPFARPTKKYRT